jgi:hypothetical protein
MKVFARSGRSGLFWYEYAVIVMFVVVFAYIATMQFLSIQENVRAISCRGSRKNINDSLEKAREKSPQMEFGMTLKPIDLKKLVENKFLDYEPVCASGGLYKINAKGEAYCDFHNMEKEDE